MEKTRRSTPLGTSMGKGFSFLSLPLSLGDCVMNRFSLPTRALRVAACAILLACVSSQASYAQLIAYEGFDYPLGGLEVVGNGALGGGTGWMPGLGWVPSFDGAFPSNSTVVPNPSNWGYTDSQGNQLASSGQSFLQSEWNNVVRNLDITAIDPSLLRQSFNNPTTLAFGASGAELWVSLIGRGDEDENAKEAVLQLMDGLPGNEVKKIGLGRPYLLQSDGTQGMPPEDNNEVWAAVDYLPSPFPNPDSYALTGNTYSDTVFMVARIQFFDPFEAIPGNALNVLGNEIVTVWVDPVLGNAQPSEASAVVQDFEVLDFAMTSVQFQGNASTWFDEIRIGLDYASVAPIAVGTDGDFDGDSDVDGADFLEWQRNLGDTTSLGLWESNYGPPAIAAAAAVPEPSSMLLAGVMTMLVLSRRTLFAAN